MRGEKSGKQIAGAVAWLLAAALTVGTLAGCGDGNESGDRTGSITSPDKEAGAEEQNSAMGRYVEKDVDLGDSSLTDWNSRIFTQKDGSLLLSDNSGFVLRSTDNGASWKKEDLAWLARMKEEDKYILTMAFGPDGTAAVIWTEPEEGSGEDGNGVQLKMDMQLTLVKPDGTEIPVKVKLEEGDMWLNGAYISDTGRIFVTAAGNHLYEVKEDGSSEKFLTVDGGMLDLVRFHGNMLLMDGMAMDTPLIYDMEKREYVEDEVLTEFVKENFADRDSYAGRSYDLFLVSGGDDAIYLAGQSGVYRHVLGGTAMEQIIDGSLSILGDPTYSIMDMLIAENNEILMILTGEKMSRFVYDPNVPSRPDEKLQVWSLEDEAVVRQAISRYQKENPAVYVDYEIALEGNAMTREDAIKNLNTRIMAGKGPDVLVLDNMPMDSYIEKGILMDIAPLLDGMEGEKAVFPNVVDAFREEGHVYMVPCGIQLPYILGRNDDVRKMTDISAVADAMEEMRENDPEGWLLRLPSAKGMMRVFSPVSVPAWRTEEGALDTDAISDFLTQTKRMYDAQMDGISEEALGDWETEKEIYQSYYSENGEELEDSDEIRTRYEALYFMAGTRQFTAGVIKNIGEYNCHTSLSQTEGFEDCGSLPMKGQCGDVFRAKTLLGVNASSENTQQAQNFIKTALGTSVQTGVEEGFPVTKEAILDSYAEQWRTYKDNDYVSGQGSTYNREEEEVVLLIRIPDEKTVNELIDWIESLNTAYVEDKIFENVVYEEGASYIEGEKSMEDAMSSIETRLGIYLTE